MLLLDSFLNEYCFKAPLEGKLQRTDPWLLDHCRRLLEGEGILLDEDAGQLLHLHVHQLPVVADQRLGVVTAVDGGYQPIHHVTV